MKILLSKSSLNDNYATWLKFLHPGIELASAFGLFKDIENISLAEYSGIVLTGSWDIHPGLYGKPSETKRCDHINVQLDKLEFRLIKIALEEKIPLLAICRGLQIINVAFGGSLWVDLPEDFGRSIGHRQKKGDSRHAIAVERNSKLYEICMTEKGEVNSSHHQAIENTGNGLVPVAWSPDGLTEAAELADAGQHPFFIGVQWHPERMDTGNPLSGRLGKRFLDICHAGQNQLGTGNNI